MSTPTTTSAPAEEITQEEVFYWITVQWDDGTRTATCSGAFTVNKGTNRQTLFTHAIEQSKQDIGVPAGEPVVVLGYGEYPRYI